MRAAQRHKQNGRIWIDGEPFKLAELEEHAGTSYADPILSLSLMIPGGSHDACNLGRVQWRAAFGLVQDQYPRLQFVAGLACARLSHGQPPEMDIAAPFACGA